MTIIIGLGNPGKKFEKTRHNIGFLVLDKFVEKNNFPEFKFSKKYESLISQKTSPNFNGRNNQESTIILVKPQTFMNESGLAVKKLVSSFKFQISNLIVIHDDIDLPIGKIKIVKERGSAGHKGVESIINNVGNNGLIRIRIGIGPEQYRGLNHGTKKAEDIVLKNFSKKEQEIMDDVNKKTIEALDFLLQNGLEKTMNEYN